MRRERAHANRTSETTNESQQCSSSSSISGSIRLWLRAHLKDILLPMEAEWPLLPLSSSISESLFHYLNQYHKRKFNSKLRGLFCAWKTVQAKIGRKCPENASKIWTENVCRDLAKQNGQTDATDKNCSKTFVVEMETYWVAEQLNGPTHRNSDKSGERLIRQWFPFSLVKSVTTAL